MKSFFSTTSITDPRSPQAGAVPHLAQLTSGRLLAGNAIWNLTGTCSPAVVAVVCLPILKHALGNDRLGIISLGWVIVGYFGLFDLGLSRALTKLVAEKLGQSQLQEIPSLIWTSLSIMACLGMVGAVVTFVLSPWLVQSLVKVPAALQHETLYAFYWLSAAIPLVVLTAGLRGVLEALQKFRLATAIRIPMGVFTYLGPVCILPFSHSLIPIMAALVIARGLFCLGHVWACLHSLPELRHQFSFNSSSVKPLFRFGSWMTVTNVVGPMMVTFDRFAIGAMISVAAVAYYAIPAEVVTKILLLPAALIGVLFPAFSTAHAANRERLVFLFEAGVKYIFAALFPIIVLVVAFAPEGLRYWLGSDFAQHSTLVVRLIAIAVFMNGVGQVPFAHLQSAGRPDITARIHLVELPAYVVVLLLFVKLWGIQGAAIAWMLRIAIDAFLMFLFSHRLSLDSKLMVSKLPLLSLGALVIFVLASLQMGIAVKIIFAGLACGAFLFVAWHVVLSPRERDLLASRFRENHAAS